VGSIGIWVWVNQFPPISLQKSQLPSISRDFITDVLVVCPLSLRRGEKAGYEELEVNYVVSAGYSRIFLVSSKFSQEILGYSGILDVLRPLVAFKRTSDRGSKQDTICM